MQKILLFSPSCFSDTDANGITMKNLLSAWSAEEKAAFYCDSQSPDYTAACDYFRLTDTDIIKSLLFKKSRHVFSSDTEASNEKTNIPNHNSAKKLPSFLKKNKYNFGFRWCREILRTITPWGKREFYNWVEKISPKAVFYMVGDSFFMDKLVMKTCKRFNLPLVLYNCEAYRLINAYERFGLERAFYKKTAKSYAKLLSIADLAVYNSELLKDGYETRYPCVTPFLAYNSAEFADLSYTPNELPRITYFGNLGVGRSESLLTIADTLKKMNNGLVLDIYGNATNDQEDLFNSHPNIKYHGFVGAEELKGIIQKSDILVQTESFDADIASKLKYAFSTKIAQCLCAGRCVLNYAPRGIASTEYLVAHDCALNAFSESELYERLKQACDSPKLRAEYAEKAGLIAQKNHNKAQTSADLRKITTEIIKGI